jgi:hypothetical protein
VILRQRRYSEAESGSRAGYELLMKQASPPANWLSKARTDLAEKYEALKQPEQTARFRAEVTVPVVEAGKFSKQEVIQRPQDQLKAETLSPLVHVRSSSRRSCW